jgi:hypothetical protein
MCDCLLRFYEWGRGSGNFTLLGCQLVSVLFVLGWAICIFGPFCMVLKALNWLRMDALEEEVGMDISRHKGPAYVSEGAASASAVAELSEIRSDLIGVSQSMSGHQPMRAANDKAANDKAANVNDANVNDDSVEA